jgi:hypothetical protein
MVAHSAGARRTRARGNRLSEAGQRWTPRRKRAVLMEITSGLLSEAQAIRDYALSAEELNEWRRAFLEHGKAGLRTTRLQYYRDRSTKRFDK